MAEFIPSTQKLDTTCPVCLDVFKRPRSLPCLHTFCSTCLQGHILNTAQNGLLSAFFCPVCRAQTRPPKPYSQRDQWAEHFPINHWIVSFMDETEKEKVRDDIIVCDCHPEFTVRLFCSDHQCVCCPMCIATEHRKCDDVKELTAVIDQFDVDKEMEVLKETLDSSSVLINDIREDRHERIMSFMSKREEIVHEIRTKKEEIINHINRIEATAFESVNRASETCIQDNETEIEWCNTAEAVIDECKQVMADTECRNSALKTFIKLSKAKVKSSETVEKVKEIASIPKHNPEMEFEFSDGMEHFQNICKDFGSLKIIDEDALSSASNGSVISEGISESTVQSENEITDTTTETLRSFEGSGQSHSASRTTWYASVAESTDPNIIIGTTNEDVRFVQRLCVAPNLSRNRCWVTSVLVMSDNCLIISDKTHNSLKMLKDGKIVSQTVFKSSPWDIARLREDCIAVTYPHENLVRFFNVYSNDVIVKLMTSVNILGSPLKCESALGFAKSCYGITCFKKSFIISCEDCLQMYSLKGSFLHTLDHKTDGQPVFRRATFITADRFRDVVYVSDEGNHTVLAIQVAHKTFVSCPKFIYKNPQLRCPQGLSVASDGSILVCGFGSKNIHRISQSGIVVSIVTTALRPWCIACRDRPNRFVVSVYPELEECRYIYCIEMKNG